MQLLTRFVTTALALAAAAWVLDGIRFAGPVRGTAELQEKAVPFLLVTLILTLVTWFVKPVLKVLSFPLILLTLGLFLIVINAFVLWLSAWLAGQLDIGFRVAGFWPAVGGALVITIVTMVVDRLWDDKK